MNKNTGYGRTYVLYQDKDKGSVRISDDVIATIAGLATIEVEGVVSTAGNISNELMSKVGINNMTKGVKVEVSQEGARVELGVVLKYGYSIPITASKIQEKVKASIENMTGINVINIDVRISGVDMTKTK